MTSPSRILPFLVGLLALPSAQAQLLPSASDFEAPAFDLGSIDGQQGWSVQQGLVEVREGAGRDETRGLVIDPSIPFGQASLVLSEPASDPVVFLDLWLRPVAVSEEQEAQLIDADGVVVGFFRFDGKGRIEAMDGDGLQSGRWVATSADYDATEEGMSTEWLQLTLRLDFTLEDRGWDLFVDGRLEAANLGFWDDEATGFQRLSLMGHVTEELRVDEVAVTTENPLFPDLDHDGMDDRFEERAGWDITMNDRSSSHGDLNRIEYYFSAQGLVREAGPVPNGGEGVVLYELWDEPSLPEERPASESPRHVEYLTALQNPGWEANQELLGSVDSRVRGYLVPETTGIYRFQVDTAGEIAYYLSSNDDPFKRLRVSFAESSEPPTSVQPFALTGGIPYYFELWVGAESLNEAAFQVSWGRVDTEDPVYEIISGESLRAYLLPHPNDLDDDGLPDDWQRSIDQAHNLSGAEKLRGSYADNDSDGLTNLEEFLAGTSPLNPDTDGDGRKDSEDPEPTRFSDPVVAEEESALEMMSPQMEPKSLWDKIELEVNEQRAAEGIPAVDLFPEEESAEF